MILILEESQVNVRVDRDTRVTSNTTNFHLRSVWVLSGSSHTLPTIRSWSVTSTVCSIRVDYIDVNCFTCSWINIIERWSHLSDITLRRKVTIVTKTDVVTLHGRVHIVYVGAKFQVLVNLRLEATTSCDTIIVGIHDDTLVVKVTYREVVLSILCTTTS